MATRISIYSSVGVVGKGWYGQTISTDYTLKDYNVRTIQDLANIRAGIDDAAIERADVEMWLTSNSGDFQSITDFAASINLGKPGSDVEIPFETRDAADIYMDCMFGGEEE